MSNRQYSKNYGDRYPGQNTSGKCIWDASMTHENNGVFPKPEYIKKLNLTYVNKQGQLTKVNPNNVAIEINSCKSFMGRFPEEYKRIKAQVTNKTLTKSASIPTKNDSYIESSVDAFNALPDEVSDNQELWEGATKKIKVNVYERSALARQICLEHYGYSCILCGFNFEEAYGSFARKFIHVHHLIPLYEINETYQIDPIRDLRPVCPNCHSAIHISNKTRSIEEMHLILKKF